MAEQIFNSLVPADSASFSAIIAGMALHGQFESAYKKYKEAKEAQMDICIDAYNHLIAGTPFLKESHEKRWEFIEEMLKGISAERIMPDLGTLNAVLAAISSMPTYKQAKTNALRVIAEFKSLGIEPSLASYFYILNIFCTERGGVSSVLIDIVDILEKQKLTLQDPKDTWFFLKAMDVCRFHLVDKDLAYRVDNLLHAGDNYNFIGDSYKESVYYRHFFMLLCRTEQLDIIMAQYNKFVPHVYIPEPAVMEEVLKTVDVNGATQYLPQLWSDLCKFDYASRETLIVTLITALKNSSTEDEKLRTDLAEIASAVLEKFTNKDEEREVKRMSWTAAMFGDILEVVLRGGKFDVACNILNILDMKQHEILGAPHIESLSAFLDACISNNDVTNAVKCIQYCSDAGFPDAGPFSQKLNNSLSLTDFEKKKLAGLVGKDFLEPTKDTVTSN